MSERAVNFEMMDDVMVAVLRAGSPAGWSAISDVEIMDPSVVWSSDGSGSFG